jgi:hypothetical protein
MIEYAQIIASNTTNVCNSDIIRRNDDCRNNDLNTDNYGNGGSSNNTNLFEKDGDNNTYNDMRGNDSFSVSGSRNHGSVEGETASKVVSSDAVTIISDNTKAPQEIARTQSFKSEDRLDPTGHLCDQQFTLDDRPRGSRIGHNIISSHATSLYDKIILTDSLFEELQSYLNYDILSL